MCKKALLMTQNLNTYVYSYFFVTVLNRVEKALNPSQLNELDSLFTKRPVILGNCSTESLTEATPFYLYCPPNCLSEDPQSIDTFKTNDSANRFVYMSLNTWYLCVFMIIVCVAKPGQRLPQHLCNRNMSQLLVTSLI